MLVGNEKILAMVDLGSKASDGHKKILAMVELGSHFLSRGASNDNGKEGSFGKIPTVVEPR